MKMSEHKTDHLDLTYYFSVMSDWAYLGAERLLQLAHRYSLCITYKPMQLPDLYSKTGGIVLQKRSIQRQEYREVDIERWSKLLGRPVLLNPPFYPADDLRAASAIVAVQRLGFDAGRFSDALLKMVWLYGKNVASLETIRSACDGVGIDAEQVLAESARNECLQSVAGNTLEAAEDGVFGSPFFLYEGGRYWGQDRLPLLEAAIRNNVGQEFPPLFQY